MNWLRNFMMGRYGTDQLTMVLLLLSVLLTFLASLTDLGVLAIASYVPLGIGIYRMFSKNISKRSMENYRFNMLYSPMYSWFLRTKGRIRDRKTYRYFKCPSCKANLRVPKGKGKVKVTCIKCKTEFIKKT